MGIPDVFDLADMSVVMAYDLAGLLLWGSVGVAPVLVVVYGVFPAGKKTHQQLRL